MGRGEGSDGDDGRSETAGCDSAAAAAPAGGSPSQPLKWRGYEMGRARLLEESLTSAGLDGRSGGGKAEKLRGRFRRKGAKLT